MDEPFRVKKAAKRRAETADAGGRTSSSQSRPRQPESTPIGRVPSSQAAGKSSQDRSKQLRDLQIQLGGLATDGDEEGGTMTGPGIEESRKTTTKPEALSDGVAAALAKLRENG